MEELVGRRDSPRTLPVGELALRSVGVGGGERGADIFQSEARVVQRRRVDVHPHGRQRSPSDDHLSDSLDLRQLLLEDRRTDVVHASALDDGRRQGEDQDRSVRRVDLSIGGVVRQVGGELAAGRVDRRLDVARRRVDVAVQVELDRDVRRAERGGRGHFGDAGDPAELALERGRNGGRHGVGARAREPRLDADGGKLDLRQRRDRKELVGDGAREGDRHGQERRGDRPVDERRREAHPPSAGTSPTAGCRPRRRAMRCARRSNAR